MLAKTSTRSAAPAQASSAAAASLGSGAGGAAACLSRRFRGRRRRALQRRERLAAIECLQQVCALNPAWAASALDPQRRDRRAGS